MVTLPSAFDMRLVSDQAAAEREHAQLDRVAKAIQTASLKGCRTCMVPAPLRPDVHEALRAGGYEVSVPRQSGYNEYEVTLTW